MTIGSLFSGIGGLELGLEWAGLGPTVWQVEQDAFCRSVLARHWPEAVRFDDVCAVGLDNLAPVDLICGGFPCQDLSYAGKGAGLAGERSGLWREYRRIVGELRPRFVVVENVAALLTRGVGDVLRDLAALGYDAEWHCIRASDVGAPHRRERLFIVAYAARERRNRGLGSPLAHALRGEPERLGEPGDVGGATRGAQGEGDERQRLRDAARGGSEDVADADASGRGERSRASGKRRGLAEPADGGSMGHANGSRLEERTGKRGNDGAQFEAAQRAGSGQDVADAERIRLDRDGAEPNAGATRGARSGTEGQESEAGGASKTAGDDGRGGLAEPRLGLAAHGLPARVDRWPAGPGEAQKDWEAPRVVGHCDNRAARLKALGNAVVPQVGEVVGRIVKEIAARA